MTTADQTAAPLLEVKDLVQRYTLPRENVLRSPGQVHALNGVSFDIMPGRSLGVVGESVRANRHWRGS